VTVIQDFGALKVATFVDRTLTKPNGHLDAGAAGRPIPELFDDFRGDRSTGGCQAKFLMTLELPRHIVLDFVS
jgi:hypothetical protein